MYTVVYGMMGQWGPAYNNRELYPIICDNFCICVSESVVQQKLSQRCKSTIRQ